jgi:glyoxylase-like metal-dependent hydrolase (beta-lactamase superfamily II)
MKEIAKDVLIETGYEGVTVGAIRTERGVIMIDTPISAKDTNTWRTTTARGTDGHERLLILLDEHFDRTTGAGAIKCPIITHELTAQALGARPSAPKSGGDGSGTIWESSSEVVHSSWLKPEITFTDSMSIRWSGEEILLEHHPGPSKGSIWVLLPERKAAFIGDTVTPGKPPFIANANLDAWLEALHDLSLVRFREYALISGRGEIVTKTDIRDQQKFLRKIKRRLEKLSTSKISIDKVEEIGASYADDFKAKSQSEARAFRKRLSYGFVQYLTGQYPDSKKS